MGEARDIVPRNKGYVSPCTFCIAALLNNIVGGLQQ